MSNPVLHFREMWEALKILESAVVTLFAVYIGARLAGRSHRRDWISDNKKEEYRELITTLTKSMSSLQSLSSWVQDPEMQRDLHRAYLEVQEVNRSRFFIVNEIGPLRIGERWKMLNDDFQRTRDRQVFIRDTELLIKEILDVAHRDVMADDSAKILQWLRF